MDAGLRVILWAVVGFVVLDAALVLTWIRADRKKARKRQAVLDGLNRAGIGL